VRLHKKAPALSDIAIEAIHKEDTDHGLTSEEDKAKLSQESTNEKSDSGLNGRSNPHSHPDDEANTTGEDEGSFEAEEREFCLQSDVEYDQLAIEEEIGTIEQSSKDIIIIS